MLIIIIVLKFNEKIEWRTTFYYVPVPLVFIGISIYLLVLKGAANTLDDNQILSELIKMTVGTISVGSFMLGLTGGCSFVNEIRAISSHSKK